MTTPLYRPYVFLRCKKCGRKTAHVLVNITHTSKKEETDETYECQECGETKKAHEPDSLLQFADVNAGEKFTPDSTQAEESKNSQTKAKKINVSDRQRLMFIMIIYVTLLAFLMLLFLPK